MQSCIELQTANTIISMFAKNILYTNKISTGTDERDAKHNTKKSSIQINVNKQNTTWKNRKRL